MRQGAPPDTSNRNGSWTHVTFARLDHTAKPLVCKLVEAKYIAKFSPFYGVKTL